MPLTKSKVPRRCWYWDRSSKGGVKPKRHNCYRANIQRNGVRYRKRFRSCPECEAYIEMIRAQFDDKVVAK